jgi:DNA (cytosine-5)-methyltransferase 1
MRDQPTSNREAELPAIPRIGSGDWLDHERETTQQESQNELHLFAGAGGGILGGILLGHTCVCAVEIEPYARQLLLQRQRDGILPRFPIWDDVRTFDGRPWRGHVQTVCGGFPCQDISAANQGATGLDGERSGLWGEMRRIVGEIRPRFALVENSPMLVVRGLDRILGDFTEMGYDTKWGVFSAADVGARHIRERLWILADSNQVQHPEFQSRERRGDKFRPHHATDWHRLRANAGNLCNPESDAALSAWWKTEPRLARLDNGVADCVDRLAASGNGQVPQVVRIAWTNLRRDFGV